MPCATVHLTMAGRILRLWEQAPDRAPVPLARPGVREAFLHGSMGPDMGFVPGTDRLMSEAAHYLSPGDLTRNLLNRAESWEEEAFAWGWAAHLLCDVEIHPLVGRAVGERLFGDRGRRVDALYDVTTHVSLEVGMDMAVLRSEPEVPRPPARPFFPMGGRVRWLTRALGETYDVDWDPGLLRRDHVQAVRMTRWWPRALSLLPLRAAGGPGAGPVSGAPVGDGPLRGFLVPEQPTPWFLREVRRRIDGLAGRFQALVEGGLSGVGNPNLETGEATGVGQGHPATDAIAWKLEVVRRGRGKAGEG